MYIRLVASIAPQKMLTPNAIPPTVTASTGLVRRTSSSEAITSIGGTTVQRAMCSEPS